jgi:hypothetical protein
MIDETDDTAKLREELATLRHQVHELQAQQRQRAPVEGLTPELLAALRANGVTRYRSGQLEVELNPAAAPGPVVIGEQTEPVRMSMGWMETGHQPEPDPRPIHPATGAPLGINHEELADRLAERRKALQEPRR